MNFSPFLDMPVERIIASNDLAIAIYDLYPISPGHTLIVSKRVIETWWDATAQEKISIITLIDEVKLVLDAHHGPDGYNIGLNAGAVAGQTVPHLHVHVIPRYTGDVGDPRGGIRHVISHKAKYWSTGE